MVLVRPNITAYTVVGGYADVSWPGDFKNKRLIEPAHMLDY